MHKQNPPHVSATIEWRDKDEIGRNMPPAGSTSFAATARFLEAEDHDIFSLILYYSEQTSADARHHDVRVFFFNPENVLLKLDENQEIYITEGVKILGKIKIDRILENN